MTKVKIWVPFDETECCMRVLSQDSEDYSTDFRAKNGFQVCSDLCPSLSVGRVVWLRGSIRCKDEFIARLTSRKLDYTKWLVISDTHLQMVIVNRESGKVRTIIK